MPISKEDDKSLWEQYHIILLSHIVLYWIWSLLDSDESLLVTWVSPPIFGLQHCCRFRKRTQLNMGGLRLNTLFSTTFSIIFFFTSSSFSSISIPSAFIFLLFLFFLFLFSPSTYVDPSWLVLVSWISTSFHVPHASNKRNVQLMLILTGLSWCHKFQLFFPSLISQINGTFIKTERFKMKPCPSQKKMTRVCGNNIT